MRGKKKSVMLLPSASNIWKRPALQIKKKIALRKQTLRGQPQQRSGSPGEVCSPLLRDPGAMEHLEPKSN